MKTTRMPQSSIRNNWSTAFAIAIAAGLSATSVFAQGYYPPNNSPIDNNPNLLAVEGKFVPASNATLVAPAPAGKHTATDAEIQAALQLAVADELDGTPIGAGVSLSGLVNEISKYRPAKTGNWMTAATAAVLAAAGDPVTVVGPRLAASSGSASSANPKGAANVVKGGLKLIILAGSQTDVDADSLVRTAVENAADYADKIVAAAMAGIKKMDAAEQPLEAQQITAAGIEEAAAHGAKYLYEEITQAAEKGRAGASSSSIIAAAIAALPMGDRNDQTYGALTGGALRGAGTLEISNVVAGAKGANGTGDDMYLDNVGAGYLAASASSDPLVVPGLVDAAIGAGNKDYIAAVVTGGISWLNRADVDIVKKALAKDVALGGNDTTQDIVEAGVRAVQKDAPNIAAGAITVGGVTIADVTEGAARGADASLIGATVAKVIKAGTISTANTKATVDGAVRGAVGTGKNGAVLDIGFQGTKASKLGNAAVDQAIETLDVLSAEGDQFRAVLGAMAADKKNALAIKLHGLANTSLDASQVDPINLGGSVVINIQANVKDFYNRTLNGLLDVANNTPIETEAVVLGAGAVNPKGAAAIASAALISHATGTTDAQIIAAAKSTNRKASFNIDLATNAALHVRDVGTADLAEYIRKVTFQNPKFAADVATGATVASPNFAHSIGHAAVFASPGNAGKIVPVLFAYAQLDNHVGPNIDNPVAAAAAISAGVTTGILEAKTGAKELNNLKAAVSAMVKAVIFLQSAGPTFSQMKSTGTASLETEKGAAGVITGYVSQEIAPADIVLPGGAGGTVGAVITAAVKAAKLYALEIAQAAGQAARSVASGYTDAASIQAAVLAAGSSFTSTQILAAVNYGISQGAASVPGAGAAGTLNYANATGTGPYVTSIFDL